jgi:hypothetical protein
MPARPSTTLTGARFPRLRLAPAAALVVVVAAVAVVLAEAWRLSETD